MESTMEALAGYWWNWTKDSFNDFEIDVEKFTFT
jgi:hypothetical protein